MSNEEYRAWAIEHEYEISHRLDYLASKCPHVSWNEAQKLWQLAVEKAKIFLSVEYICDASWGRGIAMVKDIFTEDIFALEQRRLEREQETIPYSNDEEVEEENWHGI